MTPQCFDNCHSIIFKVKKLRNKVQRKIPFAYHSFPGFYSTIYYLTRLGVTDLYLELLKVFFYTHLGYPLKFIFVFHSHVMRGIPPPSRGKVGKNWSTRSKTTVRSKRVGPLGSNGAPLLRFHSDGE